MKVDDGPWDGSWELRPEAGRLMLINEPRPTNGRGEHRAAHGSLARYVPSKKNTDAPGQVALQPGLRGV